MRLLCGSVQYDQECAALHIACAVYPNQHDDERRPSRRTPHAPDAAGAARKLGVFYRIFCVLLSFPLPTAASGSGDGAVGRFIMATAHAILKI
jgi:hypothetical protein